MRGVIAHFLPLAELTQRLGLPGRDDDLLCLGQGHTHLAWEPTHNTYAHIAAQFPPGWQPEVYIHWSLEYNPVPLGLEAADCYTVGIVGDWNLGGQALQGMGGVFDLLLADKKGCERLKAAGYENVRYARLWAYDPGVHRRLSGVERDLDVVLVGSFNHEVQKERAKWLARVAKLSRKYKVCLTSKIFGEEAVRLMNRAKIVFNRSIRGEINMRCFEGPACGALLFYERENTEIRDLFTDREECVLYGEDDLEELLDYYLTHDAERERIAEAGYRKIQAHTYAHHLAETLAIVEEAKAGRPRGERRFLSLPPIERQIQRARQWMVVPDLRNLAAAELELLQAQNQYPSRADIANALACLAGEVASALPNAAQRGPIFAQAVAYARRALELQPDYIAARLNLAHLLLAMQRPGVTEELAAAVALLQAENLRAEQLRGPYFPRRFEAFDVELERLWGATRPESAEWIAGLRSLLLWRTWLELSDIGFEQQSYADAARFAVAAVELRPEIGGSHYRLARALRALGQREQAEAAYRRTLAESPFLFEAWEERACLLLEAERPADALAVLDELLTILDGCPVYADIRPGFERLRAQARSQLRRQQAAAAAPPPRLLRLLAFPNWRDASHWQSLVRTFATLYHSGDPAVLLLRADPTADPPAEELIQRLAAFLTGEVGLPADALPNITLLNQPLPPGEEWTLFHVADAVLTRDSAELSTAHRAQADAARVPLWTLEEMAARKAA
jgi:tetratricopeptide (TPR) repeat protein